MTATAKWHPLKTKEGVRIKLATLTQKQLLQVEMLSRPTFSGVALGYEAVVLLIEYGLKDWEGIRDDNGDPVRFSPDRCWPLLEAHLNRRHYLPIALAVWEHCTLSEAERKN